MFLRYSSREMRKLQGAVHWPIGGQQAGAKPAPAGIVLADVQRAGAKLEDLLQDLQRAPQRPRVGKRPVKLHAPLLGRARDFDAGIILVGVDFQVGKGLVVAEVAVELGQQVFDQPGLHEQGVDLALGVEVVDVADFLDQPGGAGVFRGRLEEVAARAGAEVFRLADIDHPAGGILHQVDAGGVREGPHLLGRRRVVVGNLRYCGDFGHESLGGDCRRFSCGRVATDIGPSAAASIIVRRSDGTSFRACHWLCQCRSSLRPKALAEPVAPKNGPLPLFFRRQVPQPRRQGVEASQFGLCWASVPAKSPPWTRLRTSTIRLANWEISGRGEAICPTSACWAGVIKSRNKVKSRFLTTTTSSRWTIDSRRSAFQACFSSNSASSVRRVKLLPAICAVNSSVFTRTCSAAAGRRSSGRRTAGRRGD